MANSLRDQLDAERNVPKNVSGNGRKKKPSGHGDGKWQTLSTIASYRQGRNKARKVARAARKRNR